MDKTSFAFSYLMKLLHGDQPDRGGKHILTFPRRFAIFKNKFTIRHVRLSTDRMALIHWVFMRTLFRRLKVLFMCKFLNKHRNASAVQSGLAGPISPGDIFQSLK